MTDLTDTEVRAEVTRRLAAPWAGRPVLVGPGVLAGFTRYVAWFRELGCPVLVVATARGVGPVPEDDGCEVLWIEPPATVSLTDEMRLHDRMLRHLPADVRARIEAFDPDRRGVWFTTPFATTDGPVLDRPVLGGGRPAAHLALEDKMLADGIWEAAGVPQSAYRLVDLADHDALALATAELTGAQGAVWAGDARDGFNGGADYVRWVADARDRAEATAFFRLHCDRVRVMPFLEGVPCSIHGLVLADGTVALRPVEIVTLRDPASRALTYSGVGTTWDPSPADRDEMRAVARRVGEHLRVAHGYRGAFGVDGVLTADGFRPTELNSRMSAGATAVTQLDPRFFTFLQSALVNGDETGLTAADLEALVPLMDADRVGRVAAFGEPAEGAPDESYPVRWDGRAFARTGSETGNVFSIAPTPSGFFARVDPCVLVVPGQRLAPVNAALAAYLDATYGTSFGPLEAAPDVRATG